ncbi:MAG: hypothetical protein CMJ59_01840 [Planctomycetaceae bacterium]|nr:hypothetical protein [Planctomycetaceae bacterium]
MLCQYMRAIALGLLLVSAAQADLTEGLKKGDVNLTSVGPLAFGPDGVLFVSDPLAAKVYALDTGDRDGDPEKASYDLKNLGGQIAAALGTTPREVRVVDVAVNPESGNVYLSVTRGSGPASAAVLLRVNPAGDLSLVELSGIKHSQALLPNAPESRVVQRRGRKSNRRTQSITDLAFVDGRVFVAGLSNEEFASNLRSIPFPFKKVDKGTSVEIYHGAHGAFETRSPVRTFAAYKIAGAPYLLAGYTCTPLVKFPITALKAGSKIKGTTIAELGNRNRPLDMVVYQDKGKDYILIANSARGIMKVTTDNIEKIAGISKRVGGGGTAGLKYQTIEELQGITQLDRLNQRMALVLVQAENGQENLRSINLP